MKTNSEMAAKWLEGVGDEHARSAVREFAKWLTAERKKEPKPDPFPVKIVTVNGAVSVAEHRASEVEVFFEHKGSRIRLLGDMDGIHVGTIIKD